MTDTTAGRVLASTAAGLVTLLLTLAPSALIVAIVAIIAIGALGEIEYARLGPAAFLLFIAIATGTGTVVSHGLRRAWSDPDRRPGDVWIAWIAALTTLLVGVILLPIAIVFVTVDDDHALADRAALVEALWLGGHLLLAGLAYLLGRALFNTTRGEPTSTPA